jgi:hypothetical protein
MGSLQLLSAPLAVLLVLGAVIVGCGTNVPAPDNGVRVGPAGGTLTFANGVVLDIPAGALSETVDISVSGFSCAEVDQLFAAQSPSSHIKRCLGGFVAEPEGLTFAVPVKATLPVGALRSGEIPVAINIDKQAMRGFRLLSTDLVYRGRDGTAEFALHHFSQLAVAAENSDIDVTVDPNSPCFSADDKPLDPCCVTVHVNSIEGSFIKRM